MTDLTVGVIRRQRFIEARMMEVPQEDGRPRNWRTWAVKPEFQELAQKFLRNKVLIKFTTSNVSDFGSYDHADMDDVVEDIHRYCDENCTGFWTMDKSYSRDKDWDSTTSSMISKGTGSGFFEIFFENEADIAPFLNKCALMLKLSN